MVETTTVRSTSSSQGIARRVSAVRRAAIVRVDTLTCRRFCWQLSVGKDPVPGDMPSTTESTKGQTSSEAITGTVFQSNGEVCDLLHELAGCGNSFIRRECVGCAVRLSYRGYLLASVFQAPLLPYSNNEVDFW